MSTQPEVHRLEAIKQRYERGDMLYGREVIGVLLREIEVLSERCVSVLPKKPKPSFVGRCDELAKKGTGEGTCDSPTINGYCPRWRDHLEEV